VDGNIDDVFAINTATGLITVQGGIDRETHESYTLNVRVSDKGNPSLFSEKEFLVNVTDLDDNTPEFTATSYEGEFCVWSEGGVLLWYAMVRCAMVGCSVVWLLGMAWCAMVGCSVVWLLWYGMVWYGMVWYSYSVVWYSYSVV
jgi:hypothetical protein